MTASADAPRAATPWAFALLVALGGGLGSVARYAATTAIHTRSGHPQVFTVVAINLAGGILAGAAVAWWSRRSMLGSKRFALLVPGFCGGFTTFSSWAVQASDRMAEGNTDTAIAALLGGLFVGLLAGSIGARLVRRWSRTA